MKGTCLCGDVVGDPGVREIVHIFVPDGADWYEITDGLPRYDEYAE